MADSTRRPLHLVPSLVLGALLTAMAAAAAPPPQANVPVPKTPGPKSPAKSAEPPPPSRSGGVYGTPPRMMPPPLVRVRPKAPDAAVNWKQAPFYCIQTELSPATLYCTTTRFLGFFTHMKETGLGGPTYAAFATAGSPQIVKAGTPMDPSAMSECWILVWFAGAEGWTDWDSPWVVYLQKRPRAIRFDGDGLACRFDGPAGYAVLLPLYGYYKPPQKDKEFLAAHGLASKNIQTWQWANGLPADVLKRVRYWANVSRAFPIYCEDSFAVDRARDSVTIRQKFEWILIADEWRTLPIKFAPVSPVLALASRDGTFPVAYSRRLADPQMFTPYGPYMGIEGADQFDATFNVLGYVNETEAYDPPQIDADPTVEQAIETLCVTARRKFRSPDAYDYDHGGLGNFCWAIQGDQWYARGLPYYDDATRAVATKSLAKYFRDDVLVGPRFREREFPKDSGRTYYILEGPGIGSWGVLGDAGKFSTNLLETLWAYAHFTGDWALVKERWALVRKLFCTPAESKWVTFGREAIAEMGDEAPPCLAMARLAYRVGDMDMYGYASSLFARELTHHWVKQRGAAYYRANQPWHTMEFMPEEVYLTNLWGDTAAWQIDGPAYPAKAGERQYTNRWVRFKNEDVGRFYRDFLLADVRKELDVLTERWEPKRRTVNDSHIMPSLVQLRSLLLNEPPAELAKWATPEQFGGPPSGVIASCIAVLRTSHPTRRERLIPAGEPTPFAVGLEREVAGPNTYLCQAVQTTVKDMKLKAIRPVWPTVTWWGWKTPKGGRWTFGQVVPAPDMVPIDVEVVPLNWNTQVVVYTLPER